MKKDQKAGGGNHYESISPATKLLEERRKMYEIHESYEGEKERYKSHEIQFKFDEDKIKSKDKELQQELTKFCQYLHQNESKRKKAEDRSKQQDKKSSKVSKRVNMHSDRDAERTKDRKKNFKQIEELKRSQKKHMKKVVHLKKYEEYLELVRATYSDQYPEMNDILVRYQTLKKFNHDLIKSRQVLEQSNELLKKQAMTEEKQLNEDILTISNEIKQASRRIEDKIHEKNEVQSEVQQSNEEFSKKNLNLGKIFMAIDNLFFRCNQNTLRLKYEFDDKAAENRKDNKPKKNEPQLMAEELNYEQRSKHAVVKLKSIISHMKDLKAIIEDYKLQSKHKEKVDKLG